MSDFVFYFKLGLYHVLDLNAYDHMLFLSALAIPFSFKDWKKVFILVSIFTIAHCVSLALSASNIIRVNTDLIEFIIPLTILATAISNIYFEYRPGLDSKKYLLGVSTMIFGFVHGFGFSNYFNMIIAGEVQFTKALLSFATGIELAQLLIILFVLSLSFLSVSGLKIKQSTKTIFISTAIGLMTLPMLLNSWPF